MPWKSVKLAEIGLQSHTFVARVLDRGSQRHASTRLSCIWKWVNLRAGLDSVTKFSLCRTWRHMGKQRLSSTHDRCKWSASAPCRFTLGEEFPDVNWVGSWFRPGGGLDFLENRQTLGCNCNRTRSPQPVSLATLSRLVYAVVKSLQLSRSLGNFKKIQVLAVSFKKKKWNV